MTIVEAEEVMMVRMNEKEALATIKSLVEQILYRSPNHGRYETFLDDGRDFSIAVHCGEET
jgi:tetrahydromethanopterin S-methyltransferase subunit F